MSFPLLKAIQSHPGSDSESQSRVLIWATDPQNADILTAGLKQRGFVSFGTEATTVVGVYSHDLESLARCLSDLTDPEQQRTIKTLALEGETPALDDLSRIESLEGFIRHHSSRWLARMLEQRRFKSQLQPIMNADGAAVHGYEFLLRGLRPDGTTISPIEMFSAASDPLMMALLDTAGRDSAVRTAASLGLKEKLFINVMPAAFSVAQSSFVGTLDLIEAAGLAPENVVFEVVESEAVEDMGRLRAVIDFCRSAGYRIALDDFGSGFNNLNMLIGLSPDYIKLDKSLIHRITSEPGIWNITANMIDAAKQSDVLVIAEGVEDPKAARFLHTLGADFLQGYHFGRPSDTPLNDDV